ncbi:MAG TPA: hypothetical protein PLV46_29720 [Reyranella sp.]|jgi:hypothetical protein|nr:hypothetical protein [Reyranella sp.]HQT15661.1 hypothetical protein [Reyranella sp.]
MTTMLKEDVAPVTMLTSILSDSELGQQGSVPGVIQFVPATMALEA